MPSIRIGFSTDFNLTGEQIGIGTTNPTARLDVAGQIIADNLAGSGGITTFTTYSGFLDESQSLGNNVSIAETTKGNLNSLSGEIKISGEVTVTEDTKLTGGRLDSLTVTGKFDLPHGGSEDREDTPEKGSTRFNQDLGQLEFYTGYEWRTVNSYADSGGRGRGVWAGGVSPTWSNIEYVNFSTLGNSVNFGSLTAANHSQNRGSISSSTRGLFCGGNDPQVNTIEYITIASEGNAIDFGDTTTLIQNTAGGSSSTRGINASGFATPTRVNVISYVEIATLGNALDFGDCYISTYEAGGVSSPTRMLIAGGEVTPVQTSKIQVLTISSKGDTTFFGDLIEQKDAMACMNSSTRGVFAGREGPTRSKTIEYVTIASNGNAIYFGDLSVGIGLQNGGSNNTRGLIAGGFDTGGIFNTIEYITIATTGNAQDFGDLMRASRNQGFCSDSHGGLGGF